MKRMITLCSAALALVLCLGAVPARAASFVVTNLADSGAGSLRQAILDANAAAGADTISFSVSGTITLTAVLDIRDTLVIDGAGQSITISGNNAVPVMTTLFAPALNSLTLNALTIANGFDSNGFAGGGAGVYIANHVSLNVSNSVFAGNASSASAGAIYGNGSLGTTLTVANSRFTGNSGQGSSAISSGATTIITNSTFENNVGPYGAVLTNGAGATLTVSGSTFTGNSATRGAGGAISTGVPTTITNSTFHANTASSLGGALIANGGTGLVTVTNSTFSGNVSNGNSAIFVASGNPLLLRNTIIANSTGGNCSAGLQDGGGNLSDDATCGFTTATSLNSTAAQLGVLANNGGPTMTIAPLTGSPAIDQGVNTLASDASNQPLTTDQRGSGFPRISPSGGTVDRGAFEVTAVVVPPPPPTLVLATCPAATAQVGTAYSSGVAATGGTPPNTFSVSAGGLPGGLTINAASGAISGTPTTAGTFAFAAQVTDAGTPTAQTSTKACSITVTGVVVVSGQLSVSPSAVAFGTVPRLSVRFKTVTLTNSGTASVTLGHVSVTPNAGTSAYAFTPLSSCKSPLAAGKSCSIVVVLLADKVGLQSATLNIPNGAAGSPQSVALSANVVAR